MQLEALAPVHRDGMSRGLGAAPAFVSMALMLSAMLLTTVPAVVGAPVAEAGPPVQDYTGRPVVLEGIGTADLTLRIILYEWDFEGDGVFDRNSTKRGRCTHKYWRVGEYNATLRVTQYNASDDTLLTHVDTTRVNILSGRPVGRITSSTTALVDEQHRLEAEYVDPDGGILTHVWLVDGAFISNRSSFSHTFTQLGKQNVTLRVTDDEGESTEDQVIIDVVQEVEEPSNAWMWALAIIIVVVLAAIAVVAFRAILRAPRDRRAPLTYDEVSADAPDIVPEATLADREGEVASRAKPRVVRPRAVTRSPEKAKGKREEVPAAPARLPCPECGTILSEEGECPFCTSNESIDTVETRIRQLQSEGYILAKAEEELDAAKAELHVKHFKAVGERLDASQELIDEAVREHERCLALMELVDQLIEEAKDRDLDVSKTVNLLKLSRSFLKSGKYPKAIYYAERSRDHLLDALEPFDLDRYFCEHCRGEVGYEDDRCPHCDKEIESGILRRAKKELAMLVARFEAIGKEHESQRPIAAQIEKATEHLDSRSASAAGQHIENARQLLDDIDARVKEVRTQKEEEGTPDEEETRTPDGEETRTPEEEETRTPEEEETRTPDGEGSGTHGEEAGADGDEPGTEGDSEGVEAGDEVDETPGGPADDEAGGASEEDLGEGPEGTQEDGSTGPDEEGEPPREA